MQALARRCVVRPRRSSFQTTREEGVVRATGTKYTIRGVQRFILREQKAALVEEFLVQM
jgi:hypothetical protein